MKECKLPFDAQHVAADAADEIKYICKHFDKRFSASDSEKAAAEYLAGRLAEGAQDVKTEPFKVCPRAYFGWITFTVVCLLLALVSYFFSTLVSCMLLIVAVVPYMLEYVLFKRFYDPLFKQSESQNVYAVKHCSGEVKKRIVLVSHYDAGNEWHTKFAFGTTAFVTQRALNIVGVAYLAAINIARWVMVGGIGAGIAYGNMLYAGLAGLFFVIPWGATLFFVSRRIIDGANDGLSGAVTAIAALNSLKDVQFENTEVCVLLAGSGAVGMRGAMAFVDAHKQEFGDETVFLVANIWRESGALQVNTRELNGFVKSDKKLVKFAFDSAASIGAKCRGHMPVFSNTESGIFSANGLRSLGFNAISANLPDYYRTRYDSYDNLSEDCIGLGYRLALEVIGRYSGEYHFVLQPSDDSAEAHTTYVDDDTPKD